VGRDIGTVVLPDAELKIYLDASLDERARRRFLEEEKRGISASYEEIKANLAQRDQIDSTREIAPLKSAEDAINICTDDLSIEEVFEKVVALVNSA